MAHSEKEALRLELLPKHKILKKYVKAPPKTQKCPNKNRTNIQQEPMSPVCFCDSQTVKMKIRFYDPQGPGIFFVIPCIDAYKCVDLRTVSFDVPPQEVILFLLFLLARRIVTNIKKYNLMSLHKR